LIELKGKLRCTWSKQMPLKYQFEVIGMSMKDVIRDAMLIGLSCALLWHFSNIWRYGQHLIQEPNIIILCLETAGLLVIFIFGISKYLGGLKRETKGRDNDRKQ